MTLRHLARHGCDTPAREYFIPKRHRNRSAHNDLLSSQLSINFWIQFTARGVALATDEVPKIQDALVGRTTTFMKFHHVMYCNL